MIPRVLAYMSHVWTIIRSVLMGNKVYLGDSVYAEYDGYHVVLTTENGFGPTNTIYLEEGVLEALNAYVERLKRRV